MPRYIDANALLARYKERCAGCKETKNYCEHCCDLADVIDDIEDEPTADVVEVVRCKDCSYAEEIDSNWWICHNHNRDCDCDADWFCGDGASEKGHWRVNPDRERANFICSECLEEVDECEERCPHCGIAMKWDEEDVEEKD